jgi:alkylation response protein AidB-like acyl-CoA dehydrogenase
VKIEQILEDALHVAHAWAAERSDRQQRTQADPADYQRLRALGVPLMAVPVEFGGTWDNLAQSARPICTMLRTLAQGDPSITLASAMHHLVLSPWRIPTVPEPHTAAWNKQRQEVFQTVHDGAWGTITSEPGSGGDVGQTQAVVESYKPPLEYRLIGQKHFGSGSGLTSFMTTRAIPVDESQPDLFYLDVRAAPWEGTA